MPFITIDVTHPSDLCFNVREQPNLYTLEITDKEFSQLKELESKADHFQQRLETLRIRIHENARFKRGMG